MGEWFFDTFFGWIYDIFYTLQKSICYLLDFIRDIFCKLAGIETVKIDGGEEEILTRFITSPAIRNAFLGVLLVGVILLFVFVIIAIIKSEAADPQHKKTKGQILVKSLQSFIIFLLIPFLLIAGIIQSIVPYERLDGNCIVNKDGGFTGVLEIKPIEFRLLGANKQNYLIDGVLTNVLTSVGASQEAAIVKLEKPLDFDRHIQADLQRIVALAEANENGTLSDGEYAARIDVVQDRLALVDTLNTEQQVKYSCYYIAVTDRNKTSLMATLSVMRGNRHYAVNQRLCGNARNGAEINGDHQRVAILAYFPALSERYERFMRALRKSRTDQRNRSGQYRA